MTGGRPRVVMNGTPAMTMREIRLEAESTTSAPPSNCTWCWPKPRIPRKANSEWEQKHLSSGEWTRLCNRCANIRLRNPYNALLHLRKVGSGEPQAVNRG